MIAKKYIISLRDNSAIKDIVYDMFLLLINIATFIIYGLDKYFAIHDMWRISEKALLALAAVGGSIGAYVAMYTFRHKTRHQLFTVGVPVIFICQVIVLGILR